MTTMTTKTILGVMNILGLKLTIQIEFNIIIVILTYRFLLHFFVG